MLAVNEKAWKRGSTTRKRSLDRSTLMEASVPSASAAKLPCVIMAPFGAPVEPEV